MVAPCHVFPPPIRFGTVGVVRSIRAYAVVPSDGLPAASRARNCTCVSPSLLMVTPVESAHAVQVAPALIEVRTWYWPAKPAWLPGSVEPAGVSVSEATFCHAVEPPETVGAVGTVLSMRTVLVASATAGTHAETLLALSIARNCVIVSPTVLTVAGLPWTSVVHVVPPLLDVRCW